MIREYNRKTTPVNHIHIKGAHSVSVCLFVNSRAVNIYTNALLTLYNFYGLIYVSMAGLVLELSWHSCSFPMDIERPNYTTWPNYAKYSMKMCLLPSHIYFRLVCSVAALSSPRTHKERRFLRNLCPYRSCYHSYTFSLPLRLSSNETVPLNTLVSSEFTCVSRDPSTFPRRSPAPRGIVWWDQSKRGAKMPA